MDGGGIFVPGTEVAGRAPDVSVQDGQVDIVVHARPPFRPESGGNSRINPLLKGRRRPFQILLADAQALLHIPIGVGRNQAQLKRGLINL